MDVTVWNMPRHLAPQGGNEDSHADDNNIVARMGRALGAQIQEIPASTVLHTPDTQLTQVYGLQHGQVEIYNQSGQHVQTVGKGGLIGALEAWSGRNWGFSVRAVTDCVAVTLAAEAFRHLARIDTALRRDASTEMAELVRRSQLAEVLFQCLGLLDSPAVPGTSHDQATDESLLDMIAARAVWHYLHSGDVLAHQDDQTHSLFLIISGRLQRSYRSAEGDLHDMGHVEPGQSVGTFLDSHIYATTVTAVRESTLVELPPDLCQELWQQWPHAMLPFLHGPNRQQQSMLSALDRSPDTPRTLAIIPTAADVQIDEFVHDLAAAMQPYGALQILTRERVDAHHGQKRLADVPPGHPLHLPLVDWLNAQETEYERVIYVGDPTWSEWTQRCLRQADRILLVADVRRSPEPTMVEQAIYARVAKMADNPSQADVQLVLWHRPTVTQPSGTAAWLAARPVQTYYHVRRGDPVTIGALARRLTGNALGLVLAGGGARGLAHVGVLRAMEEQGVACDVVGGTSMGALAAAPFAMGWNFDQCWRFLHRFSSSKAIFDYTLPVVSFFRSDKVLRLIQLLVGDQRIEDQWRPYFAVSTDLTAKRLKVHDRGPLWQAIRASLSIPGAFSPLVDDEGHVLVDGGMMNNMPADIMRERVGRGCVIGVYVSPDSGDAAQYATSASVSGWQVLRSRLDPRSEEMAVPSLLHILVNSAMVNNHKTVRHTRRLCDLLIEPDVTDIGLLQFEKYESIVASGYEAARRLKLRRG